MARKLLAPVVAIAMIGASGLALVKSSEGLRTTAYADPVGLPTVCYGHTGPEVRVGQRVSKDYCERLLLTDIAARQVALIGPKNCIGSAPLNQNQLDALTSLTFNIGTTKVCASTLAKKLKVRDYRAASLEFTKWANARVNGKLVTLPGLIKRRTAEKTLFLAPSTAATQKSPSGALRTVSTIS